MGEVKQINIQIELIIFTITLQWHWSQKLWCKVVKNWQKNHLKALVFTILYILQLKKLMIVKIFIV